MLKASLSFIFDNAPKVHVFFLTFVFLFESIHKRQVEDLAVTLSKDLISSHVLLGCHFVVRIDSWIIL